MLEWQSRFLTTGSLEEEQYDQALSSAEALEQSGLISSAQWIELVKAANAALLRVR